MRIEANDIGLKDIESLDINYEDIKINVDIVLQATNTKTQAKSVSVTVPLKEDNSKTMKENVIDSVGKEVMEQLFSEAGLKEGAFEGCTNLKNVTIGNGVTSIGKKKGGDVSRVHES